MVDVKVIVISDDDDPDDVVFQGTKVASCPICLQHLQSQDRYFPVCGCTPFHKACLDVWFKHDLFMQRCPVCQTSNTKNAVAKAFKNMLGVKKASKKQSIKRKGRTRTLPRPNKKRRKRK